MFAARTSRVETFAVRVLDVNAFRVVTLAETTPRVDMLDSMVFEIAIFVMYKFALRAVRFVTFAVSVLLI